MNEKRVVRGDRGSSANKEGGVSGCGRESIAD